MGGIPKILFTKGWGGGGGTPVHGAKSKNQSMAPSVGASPGWSYMCCLTR